MKKFTSIKELSDQVRLTRIDKIRLGAKLSNGQGKEYPIQLPFFLLPDSVAEIHGGKIPNIVERAKFLQVKTKKVLDFIKDNAHRLAEELPVMIPVEDRAVSFPQAYKLYGKSAGLKCIGDGQNASERIGVSSDWEDVKCPCPKMKTDANPRGECTRSGNLQVILPQVNMGGTYQLDIGGVNSIIDINSAFKTVPAMVGRINMVPLMLRRVPTETHHDGKKQIHWTCQLMIVGNIEQISQMGESDALLSHRQVMQIEAPVMDNPVLDVPDAVYIQPENIKKMIQELGELKIAGKIKKGLVTRIQNAINDHNDEEIETLYIETMASVVTGKTSNDVAAQLENKQEEPPPPEPPAEGEQKPPARF